MGPRGRAGGGLRPIRKQGWPPSGGHPCQPELLETILSLRHGGLEAPTHNVATNAPAAVEGSAAGFVAVLVGPLALVGVEELLAQADALGSDLDELRAVDELQGLLERHDLR